jgi:hypothetical protein
VLESALTGDYGLPCGAEAFATRPETSGGRAPDPTSLQAPPRATRTEPALGGMSDGEAPDAIRSRAVVPTLFRDGLAYMQGLELERLIESFGDSFESHGADCCAKALRTVARGIGTHALRVDPLE